jgi:hypothetical protein
MIGIFPTLLSGKPRFNGGSLLAQRAFFLMWGKDPIRAKLLILLTLFTMTV